MIEYVVIAIVALLASALTFFSGFGLGTLLLPAFALFFPLPIAVALTAVVHFLNGLFKVSLMGRYADKPTVLRFGVPAMIASFAGAAVLLLLDRLAPLHTYEAFGSLHTITVVKIALAVLIAGFALIELLPMFAALSFDKKYLPLGGIISGFFGGVSGHQGALRSAFLVRSGLSKETFIGTGIAIALLIDIARLSVYSIGLSLELFRAHWALLLTGTIAAFTGAIIGKQLLKKVTLHAIQIVVAVMLFLIAIGLGTGFL